MAASADRCYDQRRYMGITCWRVELGPDGPSIEGTGVTLDAFLDGLVRIVFAADESDLDRVAAGDLVVDLTGMARSATAVRHLSVTLDRAGAAGLLTHSGRVEAPIMDEPSTGPFPVLLINPEIQWEDVLRPLLNIDAMLRTGTDARTVPASSLVDLLEDPDDEELDALAEDAGINLDVACRVVVLDPGRATRSLKDRLQRVASVELTESRGDVAVALVADHLVVVVPDVASTTEVPKALIKASEEVGLGDAFVGIGTSAVGGREIARSYREARWAARVARIDAASDRIGHFDAQALEAWTVALDDNLGSSATAAVDLLATHDRLHGSELVETLWVFLTSRHAQDAAGRLYLH
ncbi:MAG TPA: hypothetical protein VFK89_09260, partial [Actinomycetota bacterium]|nr:hypothetical protein [Actinomycetota bacterium]